MASAKRVVKVMNGGEISFNLVRTPDPVKMNHSEEGDELSLYNDGDDITRKKLKTVVNEIYGIQKFRIRASQRIFSTIVTKMGIKPGEKIYVDEKDITNEEVNSHDCEFVKAMDNDENAIKEQKEQQKLEKERGKLMTSLVKEFNKITDGLISVMIKPELMDSFNKSGINKTELTTFSGSKSARMLKQIIDQNRDETSKITDVTMYYLIHEYVSLKNVEDRLIKLLPDRLEEFDVYKYFLKYVRGCGPSMAACILAKLDIYKANSVSSFHMYTGTDVLPDGTGRSRTSPMIQRTYIDKNGVEKIKDSITYDPWIKSKLLGCLADYMVMSGSEIKETDSSTGKRKVNARPKSRYYEIYEEYKNRIKNREKEPVEVVVVKDGKPILDRNGNPKTIKKFTNGHIERMAKRYMIKMFLQDLYIYWSILEGIEVKTPYVQEKLGYQAKLNVLVFDLKDKTGKTYRMIPVLWEPVVVDFVKMNLRFLGKKI